MKKYALVNNNHVRFEELRETPKFLISNCVSRYKFKKTGNDGCIASNRRLHNWSMVGYDVYEVDHPHVLSLIEQEKKEYFAFHVREKIEKLYRNRGMSFEEAKKINELLELGVDL